MACKYNSNGAISGGITLKNGTEFCREFLPKFDAAGPRVQDEGYSLINEVRTRIKIFRDNPGKDNRRCTEFYKDGSNEVLFAYGDF